jgi:cell division transport system ATP-binding protein
MPADLQIPVGSLTFLTGASGSGKTSLLRLFMGMVQPTEGTLHVLGLDMGRAGHAEVRRLRQSVGPVFQAFRLIPGRTALENVMSGSRFLPSCSGQLRQEALDVLSRVGLSDKARTPVDRLSWGERQRVAIARAVARKPALILADEPTGNLDQENALNILHLLASFRDRQTTVVITTHATHLIAPVQPDFALRLEAGVLVARTLRMDQRASQINWLLQINRLLQNHRLLRSNRLLRNRGDTCGDTLTTGPINPGNAALFWTNRVSNLSH